MLLYGLYLFKKMPAPLFPDLPAPILTFSLSVQNIFLNSSR